MSELIDKTMAMLRYNHSLTKRHQIPLTFGIGNCHAEFFFVIKKQDFNFLYFLERVLSKFDLEVSDIYITYFDKGKLNNNDLIEILKAEIDIVNPVEIIVFETIDGLDLDDLEAKEILGYQNISSLEEKLHSDPTNKDIKKKLIQKQKQFLSNLTPLLKQNKDNED